VSATCSSSPPWRKRKTSWRGGGGLGGLGLRGRRHRGHLRHQGLGLGLGHLTNAAAGAWVAWLVGATVVFMEILGAGMAAGDMGN
jgi:hypothetical protein